MDNSLIKILLQAKDGLLKIFTGRKREVWDEPLLQPNQISPSGLNLIAKFEGFSATPYKDAGNKMTIGYGHLIKPGESFTSLTNDEALALLKVDAQIAVKVVNDLVKVELEQDQFDALVSFVYNIGSGAFNKSTVLKLVNAEQFYKAGIEMLKWKYVKGKEIAGLLNRRRVESMLLYGVN